MLHSFKAKTTGLKVIFFSRYSVAMLGLDELSSEDIERTSSASTTNTIAQEQSGYEDSKNLKEEVLTHEAAEKMEKPEASNVSEGIISGTEELALTPNEEPVPKTASGKDKAPASADAKEPYFIPMPGVPDEEIFNVSIYK